MYRLRGKFNSLICVQLEKDEMVIGGLKMCLWTAQIVLTRLMRLLLQLTLLCPQRDQRKSAAVEEDKSRILIAAWLKE